MDPRRRKMALQLAALSVAAVGMMLLGQAASSQSPREQMVVAGWSP